MSPSLWEGNKVFPLLVPAFRVLFAGAVDRISQADCEKKRRKGGAVIKSIFFFGIKRHSPRRYP